MKKTISLIKNYGVTLILLSGSPFGSGFMLVALVVKKQTTVQIKNVPPNKIHTGSFASGARVLALYSAAEIELNTSGAPLPKARSVTPPNDSLQLNTVTMDSKLGERYASAVSESKYIPRKTKNPPIITKAINLPTLPKASVKVQ